MKLSIGLLDVGLVNTATLTRTESVIFVTMISVITPSVRPDGLEIVKKCLKRQTIQDFEWIIASPQKYFISIDRLIGHDYNFEFVADPPKEEGDFWTLCKAWNNAYAHAKGELIVNIQDWIWFPPDLLERFWYHYQSNPRILVSAVGDQYERLDDRGVPTNVVWYDPRKFSTVKFEDSPPSEMEMAVCSIPKQALIECGGLDEEYDKCCGVQEKEMCWRLNRMNWDFFVDRTIEYKALYHPRLTEDWDKIYKEKTTPIFVRHMKEITDGTRTLNVNNLSKYN